MNKGHFDAAIIGGGPAGASCALWLKMLGFKPCIIEKRQQLGGLQNDSPYINDWIATTPNLTGQEIASTIHLNIIYHNIPFFLESTVIELQRHKNTQDFILQFLDNAGDVHSITSSVAVIACGVLPQTGGFTPTSKLLIGPGQQIEGYNFSSKSVAILGGGDNAFENYHLIKAKKASSVHIYARTIKARKEFLIRTPATDISIGDYHVDENLHMVAGKKYDCIAVFYGWAPALPTFTGLEINRAPSGFIIINPITLETSEIGIYAIGEITQRTHPCVITSMADGVIAAKAIQKKLE